MMMTVQPTIIQLKGASSTASSSSPFFRPSEHGEIITQTPGGTKHKRTRTKEDVIDEHKSTILGCSANLINAIVGSGIVGLPYAIKETGFCAGVVLIFLCAFLTEKSLRLLIETAKHANVPSYETVAEAAYGRVGFHFVAVNMFIMAYGAMLSYLMIVKDTFSAVLGVPPDDVATKRAILFVISTAIMVPLSSQRDMADLAKTSRVSVTFDLIMVCIVIYLSNLPEAWKTFDWRTSIIHVETIFVGVGVLSFAFVCQHSAFIIAGSLDRPTKVRWATVTRTALIFAAFLTLNMGVGGFVGFQDYTEGNILNNLPDDSKLANVARALLGITMLFVYPMESFVARHVCVVLLFQGRHAHEGDDSNVLNRRDRRITLTVALYLLALVPAAMFENLGSVLAATGAVGGSCLSYIGPGIIFIGVHGGRFLELSDSFFGRRRVVLESSQVELPADYHQQQQQEEEDDTTQLFCESGSNSIAVPSNLMDSWFTQQFKSLLWFLFGMPLWYPLARVGKQYLTSHVTEMALKSPHPIRIGNVRFARAKLRSGDTRVFMLSPKGEAARSIDVDTKLLRADSLSRSYDSQRMSNGTNFVRTLSAPTKPKVLLASTEDTDNGVEQSINQKIGAMVKRQREEDDLAIEDDPQHDPPEVRDFMIALFYIAFGVIAMLAGLLSIFV